MGNLIGIFKKIGTLKDLITKDKTNLVSSINEVANDQAVLKEQVDSSVESVEAGLNYNTIKITKNDGTVENVLIKIQGGQGSSINVFKSAQQTGSYIATETTDSFVVEELDSTKDIELIYNNFLLVQNVDYTVDKETGTIGLSFEMKTNEVIYYVITNTSYDYNDLDNLPDLGAITGQINDLSNITPSITPDELDNPQKEHIFKDLSIVDTVYVDANNPMAVSRQIKTDIENNTLLFRTRNYNSTWQPWQQLATVEQLNVLNEGKINNICVANDIFDNGKIGYTINTTGTETLPSQAYIRHCISYQEGRSLDIAYGILNNYGFTPSMYFRTKHDTNIGGWQQIATTTKTEIPVPYDSGFEHHQNTIYTSKIIKNALNECTLIMCLKRTDGTPFKANTNYKVATLPTGFVADNGYFGVGNTWGVYNVVTTYVNNSSVFIAPPVDSQYLIATIRFNC